jgi:hypothetical protein
MAKHVMIKYFDFCDKNNYKIYYCNTDSILIRESDYGLMKQFISDSYGDLKVEGRYNNGVIISQDKFSLFGKSIDDKNKIRNKKIQINRYSFCIFIFVFLISLLFFFTYLK